MINNLDPSDSKTHCFKDMIFYIKKDIKDNQQEIQILEIIINLMGGYYS